MPVPIALLAPLLFGGGYAAKQYTRSREAKHQREFFENTIPQMLANINAQQATSQVPGTVAGQPQPTETQPPAEPVETEVPEEAKGVGIPEVEEEELEPEIQMRPGRTTDLPILPTQKLALSQAPMIMKGGSIDESGNMNMQFGRDEAVLAADWFRHFQTNMERVRLNNPLMTDVEAEDQAMQETILRTRRLPSAQMLNMLDPERRERVSEQTYWSAVWHMAGNQQIRQALAAIGNQDDIEVSPQMMDSIAFHYALRAVTNEMGGYMPEQVREILIPLEKKPIDEKTALKAFEMFGLMPQQLTPEQVQATQEQIKDEKLSMTYDEKVAELLGEEEGKRILHEAEFGARGVGETAREIDRKKALAKGEPIKPEDRAKLGIPESMETYLDVVNQGYRLLSPQDQRSIDRIKSVVQIVNRLKDLSHGYTDENGVVHPGIFTSKDDYWSRVEHGVFLKMEQAKGSVLGVDVDLYNSLRKTMIRTLLELAGEAGGRFTDKDMDQIMEAVAGVKLFIFPEGAGIAKGKSQQLDNLLMRKLTFIKSPQMIKMQTGKKATRRYNPDTGKTEVIE